MSMTLASLNCAIPKLVLDRGRPVSTGIFKTPVPGPVMLRTLNFEGDRQADLESHGGLNKAAYAYSYDHYPFWAEALERNDLHPGQFGENLTIEGLSESSIFLGDVYHLGQAQVVVAQPRIPCYKLGIRMGMPTVPKLFLASGKLGVYFKVLQEGIVSAGDSLTLLHRDQVPVSLHAVWHLIYRASDNLALAERILAYKTLGPEWRIPLERLRDGDKPDT